MGLSVLSVFRAVPSGACGLFIEKQLSASNSGSAKGYFID